MPFTVELIAVDQQLKAPNGLIQDADLRYVPTFVVLRGGKELGRVVESAETTIEADLGALLRADRTGLVTGRRDGAR